MQRPRCSWLSIGLVLASRLVDHPGDGQRGDSAGFGYCCCHRAVSGEPTDGCCAIRVGTLLAQGGPPPGRGLGGGMAGRSRAQVAAQVVDRAAAGSGPMPNSRKTETFFISS